MRLFLVLRLRRALWETLAMAGAAAVVAYTVAAAPLQGWTGPWVGQPGLMKLFAPATAYAAAAAPAAWLSLALPPGDCAAVLLDGRAVAQSRWARPLAVRAGDEIRVRCPPGTPVAVAAGGALAAPLPGTRAVPAGGWLVLRVQAQESSNGRAIMR